MTDNNTTTPNSNNTNEPDDASAKLNELTDLLKDQLQNADNEQLRNLETDDSASKELLVPNAMLKISSESGKISDYTKADSLSAFDVNRMTAMTTDVDENSKGFLSAEYTVFSPPTSKSIVVTEMTTIGVFKPEISKVSDGELKNTDKLIKVKDIKEFRGEKYNENTCTIDLRHCIKEITTTRDRLITIGRKWSMARFEMYFCKSKDWGSEKLVPIPAMQELGSDIPTHATITALNDVAYLFPDVDTKPKIGNVTRASIQSRLNSEVNVVRFAWRLAAMYVGVCFNVTKESPMIAITANAPVDVDFMSTMNEFTAMLDKQENRDIVPYVMDRVTGDEIAELTILRLAASDAWDYTYDVPTVCAELPKLRDPKLLVVGRYVQVNNSMMVSPEMIWTAAVRWLRKFGDVELFKECVESCFLLSVSHNGSAPITGADDGILALPVSKMDALTIGILTEKFSVTHKDTVLIAPPDWRDMLPKFCYTNLCYALATRESVRQLGADICLHMDKETGVKTHQRDIYTTRGDHCPILSSANRMLKAIGIDVEIGRICGRFGFYECDHKSISSWWLDTYNAVEWEELLEVENKLPQRSSLWADYNNVKTSDDIVLNKWYKSGTLPDGMTPVQAFMAFDYVKGVRLGLNVIDIKTGKSWIKRTAFKSSYRAAISDWVMPTNFKTKDYIVDVCIRFINSDGIAQAKYGDKRKIGAKWFVEKLKFKVDPKGGEIPNEQDYDTDHSDSASGSDVDEIQSSRITNMDRKDNEKEKFDKALLSELKKSKAEWIDKNKNRNKDDQNKSDGGKRRKAPRTVSGAFTAVGTAISGTVAKVMGKDATTDGNNETARSSSDNNRSKDDAIVKSDNRKSAARAMLSENIENQINQDEVVLSVNSAFSDVATTHNKVASSLEETANKALKSGTEMGKMKHFLVSTVLNIKKGKDYTAGLVPNGIIEQLREILNAYYVNSDIYVAVFEFAKTIIKYKTMFDVKTSEMFQTDTFKTEEEIKNMSKDDKKKWLDAIPRVAQGPGTLNEIVVLGELVATVTALYPTRVLQAVQSSIRKRLANCYVIVLRAIERSIKRSEVTLLMIYKARIRWSNTLAALESAQLITDAEILAGQKKLSKMHGRQFHEDIIKNWLAQIPEHMIAEAGVGRARVIGVAYAREYDDPNGEKKAAGLTWQKYMNEWLLRAKEMKEDTEQRLLHEVIKSYDKGLLTIEECKSLGVLKETIEKELNISVASPQFTANMVHDSSTDELLHFEGGGEGVSVSQSKTTIEKTNVSDYVDLSSSKVDSNARAERSFAEVIRSDSNVIGTKTENQVAADSAKEAETSGWHTAQISGKRTKTPKSVESDERQLRKEMISRRSSIPEPDLASESERYREIWKEMEEESDKDFKKFIGWDSKIPVHVNVSYPTYRRKELIHLAMFKIHEELSARKDIRTGRHSAPGEREVKCAINFKSFYDNGNEKLRFPIAFVCSICESTSIASCGDVWERRQGMWSLCAYCGPPGTKAYGVNFNKAKIDKLLSKHEEEKKKKDHSELLKEIKDVTSYIEFRWQTMSTKEGWSRRDQKWAEALEVTREWLEGAQDSLRARDGIISLVRYREIIKAGQESLSRSSGSKSKGKVDVTQQRQQREEKSQISSTGTEGSTEQVEQSAQATGFQQHSTTMSQPASTTSATTSAKPEQENTMRADTESMSMGRLNVERVTDK